MKATPWLLAAAVAAVAALAGCASSGTTAKPAIPDRREQLGRAQKLAQEAQAAYEAGDLDKAILLSRDAVSLARDYGQAWNNLGLFLLERDERFEAREAFAIAADLLPSDPRPLNNLGVMYLDNGWADKALDYFERALERSPSDHTALRGAIDAALRLRRHDERLLERLERAVLVEADPTYRREFELRRVQVADELRQQRRDEREAAVRGGI